MGHERVGSLPKSERWRGIVNSISSYTDAGESIVDIASQTTKNVRHRFQNIENDSGVFAAFKYVLSLTYFSKSPDAFEKLNKQGIDLPKDFNLYDLAYSIQNYINRNADSKEYSVFAAQSMIDTISEWARQHEKNQFALFDSGDKGLELWTEAANGTGFCELSRLFFAKFTEKYLKYFLEREAAAGIDNIYEKKTIQ